MITLILTRHGETDWNVKNLMAGWSNKPKLTETGEKQAKDLGEALIPWNVDLIFSSPLLRTRKTAEIINKSLNKQIVLLEGLKERSWGDLQGTNREKIFENLGKMDFKKRYKFKPKGGESLEEFEKRLLLCVEKIIENNDGKVVLLVTHAGVIRVLIPLLKKIPKEEIFDLKVENSSLTVFKLQESEVIEELINDVAHLKD